MREELRVVGEADVQAAPLRGDPGHGRVERLDADRHLVRARRQRRLVDLDPVAASVDDGGRVRAHDVLGDVEQEPPPRVRALLGRRAEGAVAAVMLVVRPVDDRVRARERRLQAPVGARGEEAVLVHVVRPLDRRLLDDRRLGVVLVVERADRPALLEAARVPDDVVVHLRPPLLAVVDDVEAGTLQEREPVARRPVVDQAQLVLAELVPPEHLDELLRAVELELPRPALRLGDVVLLDRPAGERLHAPGWLGEAADLTGLELHVGHAAVSFARRVRAAPSRARFSRAIGSETYWRSPFGTSATRSTARRSTKSAISWGSSRAELRASTTPARRSLSNPRGRSA